MVVNFRARGISRDAYKLARTPTLIKKNIIQWTIIWFKKFKNQISLKSNLIDTRGANGIILFFSPKKNTKGIKSYESRASL